jgi:hypothetical protein
MNERAPQPTWLERASQVVDRVRKDGLKNLGVTLVAIPLVALFAGFYIMQSGGSIMGAGMKAIQTWIMKAVAGKKEAATGAEAAPAADVGHH